MFMKKQKLRKVRLCLFIYFCLKHCWHDNKSEQHDEQRHSESRWRSSALGFTATHVATIDKQQLAVGSLAARFGGDLVRVGGGCHRHRSADRNARRWWRRGHGFAWRRRVGLRRRERLGRRRRDCDLRRMRCWRVGDGRLVDVVGVLLTHVWREARAVDGEPLDVRCVALREHGTFRVVVGAQVFVHRRLFFFFTGITFTNRAMNVTQTIYTKKCCEKKYENLFFFLSSLTIETNTCAHVAIFQ